MSSDAPIALRVSGLGKAYRIYDRPADRLKQMLLGRLGRSWGREFWAVAGLDLSIRRGESVGVIGRNGSGKSTFLQMVAGVVPPTCGEIDMRCSRVAALLELGAGFNPEFTGRENLFLNGAILGLSSAEMKGKVDEILAFADIGDFVDQPVKTYSSGMLVRLAFAVQAAVEPELLIVDEALSVGDVAFRNRCMQRVHRLQAAGTTILFVSHDLGMVQTLCSRAVWLDGGRVRADGDPVSVCQDFYAHALGVAGVQAVDGLMVAQQDTGKAVFTRVAVAGAGGSGGVVRCGDDLAISFSLRAIEDLPEAAFAVSIYRADGDWLIGQTSREAGVFWPARRASEVAEGRIVLRNVALAPGDYRVALAAYDKQLNVCYALTDLTASFSVRSSFPTWGKIVHACQWQAIPA